MHGVVKDVLTYTLKAIIYVTVLAALIVFATGSSLGVMLLLGAIYLTVRRNVRFAFSDPEDINYVRKTDRELYNFVFEACLAAFVFSLMSFQVLLYIALMMWAFFIMFMLMFTRVWKFHGKKNLHFFAILIASTLVSLAAAPFIRTGIYKLLNMANIY